MGPYSICTSMDYSEDFGICVSMDVSRSTVNSDDTFGTIRLSTFSGIDRHSSSVFQDIKRFLSIQFRGPCPYTWMIGPDEIVLTNSNDRTKIIVANPHLGAVKR